MGEELAPVPCSLWAHNMAVVSVVQRKSTKHCLLLHLFCCLYFYAAHFQFTYSAHPKPGVTNVAADSPSRSNMTLFTSLVPRATRTYVSQELIELLIFQQPNWGSQDWISLFWATLWNPTLQVLSNPTNQLHSAPLHFATTLALGGILSFWGHPRWLCGISGQQEVVTHQHSCEP